MMLHRTVPPDKTFAIFCSFLCESSVSVIRIRNRIRRLVLVATDYRDYSRILSGRFVKLQFVICCLRSAPHNLFVFTLNVYCRAY